MSPQNPTLPPAAAAAAAAAAATSVSSSPFGVHFAAVHISLGISGTSVVVVVSVVVIVIGAAATPIEAVSVLGDRVEDRRHLGLERSLGGGRRHTSCGSAWEIRSVVVVVLFSGKSKRTVFIVIKQ